MHGRRRLSVALGIASVASGAWLGRVSAERVLLPLLPLHGDCLDTVGGWADLSRGDLPLPAEQCPAAAGSCEPALMLADDASVGLSVRLVARRHAIEAGCPPQGLRPDDLTLPPGYRRAHATARQELAGEPWGSEAIAIHGLWGDALLVRAGLGDPAALDLAADLVRLDAGAHAAAEAAIGADSAVAGVAERWPGAPVSGSDTLSRRLIAAAGAPERGPNAVPALELAPGVPGPPAAMDLLTGSGDATHALLEEVGAVRGFVGADRERLEAALFSSVSTGSAPGDVHGAFVAGGGSPGATALAAELTWGRVATSWTGDAVRVDVPVTPGGALADVGGTWLLDGCVAPRRADLAVTPSATPVPALALALAERVGVLLRAGDARGAEEVAAVLLASGATGGWVPPLFLARPRASAGPPWLPPPAPRERGQRRPAPPPLLPAFAPAPAREPQVDDFVAAHDLDQLAVAAWAAWRSQEPEAARALLRTPPAAPWPRYAWRAVAEGLGEPTEAPVRPEGCPPPLWAGPG